MIPLFKVYNHPSCGEAVSKVLQSGWVGQGPLVDEFEKKIAAFLRVDPEQVVTVNSCTSALQLALRLGGIDACSKPNCGYTSNVISTPATNLATNSVILVAGRDIKWADVGPSGRVDSQSVERKVDDLTCGIIVMDWGGHPCDLLSLRKIADTHDLPLIVDAAHSFGAHYRGDHQSKVADFVAHSFQAVKHLNTGDGGALICKNVEDAKRARLLRWFGLDRRNTNIDDPRCEQVKAAEYGYKFHMNDIAAAIGLENIVWTPWVILQARNNAAYYNERFEGIEGLRFIPREPDNLPTYWLYTLLIDKGRDQMIKALKGVGINASKVHSRNDEHPAFSRFMASLPGVDQFYERQFNIPVGWWLTEKERESIADYVIALAKELLK